MINPYLIAGLVASHAALLGLYGWAEIRVGRAQTSLAEAKAEHSEQALIAAEAITRLQDEAVTKEREAVQELAALSTQFHREQRDAQARTDRTLSELRSGNLRLRDRLAAASCPGVPGTADGSGGSDAAGGAGLRPEDADFLIRESDRADDVARRLTLCQAAIRTYQQLAGARP